MPKKRTPKQQEIHDRAMQRAMDVARDRHVRLETERVQRLEDEVRRQKWSEGQLVCAVYVTITKSGKPRYSSFSRGRLWPLCREAAEASFAAGATVYRKRAGVSVWIEAPEVVIG